MATRPAPGRRLAASPHQGQHQQTLSVMLLLLLLLLAPPGPIQQAHGQDSPQAQPFEAAPRGPGWRGWLTTHEALVNDTQRLAGASAALEVAMYGDSITEYARGTAMGEPCCAEYHAAWRHVIGQRFNAALFAISGDQTPHLLWRMQHGELGALQPRVAVLLIGTNDLGFAMVCQRNPHCSAPAAGNLTLAAERAVATIAMTVDYLLQATTATRVLLQAVLPRGFRGGHKQPSIFTRPIAHLNSGLRALAASRKRVYYIDCGADFVAPGGQELVEAFMPDALHPSAAGALLMYQCVACAVEALLQHPQQGAAGKTDLGSLPCCTRRNQPGGTL